MAGVKFVRDPSGVAAILKGGEVAGVILALAGSVAASSGGEMYSYTLDRAAASVALKGRLDDAGAKLTGAAAAAGLEVRSKR